MELQTIIGLEIHLRLNTQSKMFCGTSNVESETPNSAICPTCVGHPGTLPQFNQEALRLGASLALALHCRINEFSPFDRKHYFYPDLPKGYQITQFQIPLAEHGYVDFFPDDMTKKRIRIQRLHLEEDAAKSKHITDGETFVDYNRAGAPLAELVTHPDIENAQEAKVFLQELQQLARYSGASQADMEKGHMRVDVNISLRPVGEDALYPKTEIKNINSFRAVERAIAYEVERQTALWEKHAAPEEITTRGWDDVRGVTVEQRTKENAADYRYIPEPDIPPIVLSTQQIEEWQQALPELPLARRQRFMQEYELSYHDARTLLMDPRVGDFFEHTVSELREWLTSLDTVEGSDEEVWKQYRKKIGRLTSGWVTSELFKLLKESGEDFGALKFSAENFAELLTLVYEKRINSSAAQKVLTILFREGGDPSVIMREHDLEQLSDDSEIDDIVSGVIATHPDIVAEYKAGKENVLKFLMGQVMKESKGKANPEVATQMLQEKLR